MVLASGCASDEAEAPNAADPVSDEQQSHEAAQAGERVSKESDGDGLFASIPEIVEDVSPSVVAILLETPEGQGEGSGVIWDEDGLIITNNHVIASASEITVVLASGERLPAEVLETDPLGDLAVLEIDRTNLPAATFADELPEIGELAIAIGNPLGFESTVTVGVISGLGRAIPSGGQTPSLVELLQTDAPISPGNSGGALVNTDRDVVGISVAFIPPEAGAVALGFAIPAPTVVDVVEQLLATGRVRRAFLGVAPAPLTSEVADRFGIERTEGVIVLDVTAESARGLQPGDLIIAFDDEPIRVVEDLFSVLRRRNPGDSATITVIRDGTEETVDVVLGERPEP